MTTRVPGHTLRSEGAAYIKAGCCDWARPLASIDGHGLHRLPVGQGGHGVCSCGEYSAHLYADNERKRWHREHKDLVQQQLASDIGHVSRSWGGPGPCERSEACSCPKGPCGFAVPEADSTCPEHGVAACKTIRSFHSADQCPGGTDG